jgi:hypothetical protein
MEMEMRRIVSLTSEKDAFPSALAARTRSPTTMSAIALMSPDSSCTVSVPAKHCLPLGEYAGSEAGYEVLKSEVTAPTDAVKPFVAPTAFRELARVGPEFAMEVSVDALVAVVET